MLRPPGLTTSAILIPVYPTARLHYLRPLALRYRHDGQTAVAGFIHGLDGENYIVF